MRPIDPAGTGVARAVARGRKWLRVAWLAAVLVVIVGSLLPSTSAPIRALDRLPIGDKPDHVGAYAVLAFLPALHERRRVVIAAAAGAVVLGVGLEFGQLLSGWRDFEVADMVADAVGVGVGLGLGSVMRAYVAERAPAVLTPRCREAGFTAVPPAHRFTR